MRIVTGLLKTRDVDGIAMVKDDVPIGKIYRVDLDAETTLCWWDAEAGVARRDLRCVPDVEIGGWIPLDVLDIPP